MATHFRIFAWRISWTEEPGGLQSMASQKLDTNELKINFSGRTFGSLMCLNVPGFGKLSRQCQIATQTESLSWIQLSN